MKTWNYIIYFSRPGKCLEFAQKIGSWNFNPKPGKRMQFINLVFQNSLYKISFTKYLIQIFVISTQTLI